VPSIADDEKSYVEITALADADVRQPVS